MKIFMIEGYRVKAHAGGKTEVYRGRRKIGVWWVSAIKYQLELIGDDLEANARSAIEAAKERESNG